MGLVRGSSGALPSRLQGRFSDKKTLQGDLSGRIYGRRVRGVNSREKTRVEDPDLGVLVGSGNGFQNKVGVRSVFENLVESGWINIQNSSEKLTLMSNVAGELH